MGKPITKRIQRRYPESLDITEVHATRQDAEDYAMNNPTAYTGQVVTFTEDDAESASVIQADKTLLGLLDTRTKIPITYVWNATFNNQTPALIDGTVTVHTIPNTNPVRRVADVYLTVNITNGTTVLYLPFPADSSRVTQRLTLVTAAGGNNRVQYFNLTQTSLPISGVTTGLLTVFGRYSML
jgi:hypothetical protein